MGLTTKKLELSKEDEEKVRIAQLKAQKLRESGCGEMFDGELTEEDEKFMLEFRKTLK